MPAVRFDTPVKYLPGVGETRAKALARLGIDTVGQLVCHFPRGYEYRGNVKLLSAAVPGETASFILTAATDLKNAEIRRGMVVGKCRAFDESGSCEITYFNQPFLKDVIRKGGEYRFWGKLTVTGNKYFLSSPVCEPIVEGKELAPLVAVYPLSAGLSQKMLTRWIRTALEELIRGARTAPDILPEKIPDEIRSENHLCSLSYALTNIHCPPDFEALSIAKRRLIFEELYTFALGISGSDERKGHAPLIPKTSLSDFLAALPFTLTGAQKRAIAAITEDMAGERPMRRLLTGDVGSGKTAVAAAAVYFAAKAGFQSALMAPTEILARQHYEDLSRFFAPLGIKAALLTGSVGAAARKKIFASLKTGEISLLVGTHALIGEEVSFASLGLVICDEQHRFGAGQREALLAKATGETCHSLTMSATPIPRTLAMFFYGNLDVSMLDELPPGRQRVDTFVVDESYRERLNTFIRKQVTEGHQVYVICPSVEEIEEGELTQEDIRLFDYGYDIEEITRVHEPPKAAVTWAVYLQETLSDLKIACVHGKMKAAEKEKIMRSFAEGETQVLVSTTVVEVGVNVPNATLMIVENAERFGLSQLHQLRGRVGRGTAKSYCILVSDTPSDSKANRRLNALKTTYDGFKIAEFDLGERGPGDFLKAADDEEVRQHGELRFRLANLCEDMDLLEAALKAAGKKTLFPEKITERKDDDR